VQLVPRRASPPSPGFRPAPTLLANQAFKLIPETKIVTRYEKQQGKNEREPAPKCPIESCNADGAPANGLDDIEKQVSSIQQRDWQEVDESEIN
jgi:hypothetical protein